LIRFTNTPFSVTQIFNKLLYFFAADQQSCFPKICHEYFVQARLKREKEARREKGLSVSESESEADTWGDTSDVLPSPTGKETKPVSKSSYGMTFLVQLCHE